MSARNPPEWVTSWPDWMNTFGNVRVCPKLNHEALVRAIAELPSGMRDMVFEDAEKHLQDLIVYEGRKYG